jgi:hypothetical protein
LDLEKKQLALRGLDGKYKTHLYSTKQFSSLHPQLEPGDVAARISKDNGQTMHHIGELTCLLSVGQKEEGRGRQEGPRGSNLHKVEGSKRASGQEGAKILVTNDPKNSQDAQNDQIVVTVDPEAPEAQNTQNNLEIKPRPSQLKLERVMRIKEDLIDEVEGMDEVIEYDMDLNNITIGEDFSQEFKEKLRELIGSYLDVFAKDSNEIGRVPHPFFKLR